MAATITPPRDPLSDACDFVKTVIAYAEAPDTEGMLPTIVKIAGVLAERFVMMKDADEIQQMQDYIATDLRNVTMPAVFLIKGHETDGSKLFMNILKCQLANAVQGEQGLELQKRCIDTEVSKNLAAAEADIHAIVQKLEHLGIISDTLKCADEMNTYDRVKVQLDEKNTDAALQCSDY